MFTWIYVTYVLHVLIVKQDNNNDHFTQRSACVSARISSETRQLFIEKRKLF